MKKTVLFVVILLTGIISLSIYATVRNGQNSQDGTITTATVQPEESILGTWQLIEADHVKITDKKQLKHRKPITLIFSVSDWNSYLSVRVDVLINLIPSS